ncbi:hypothetical protein Tco_1221480 [Tanacetum coccineum]
MGVESIQRQGVYSTSSDNIVDFLVYPSSDVAQMQKIVLDLGRWGWWSTVQKASRMGRMSPSGDPYEDGSTYQIEVANIFLEQEMNLLSSNKRKSTAPERREVGEA